VGRLAERGGFVNKTNEAKGMKGPGGGLHWDRGGFPRQKALRRSKKAQRRPTEDVRQKKREASPGAMSIEGPGGGVKRPSTKKCSKSSVCDPGQDAGGAPDGQGNRRGRFWRSRGVIVLREGGSERKNANRSSIRTRRRGGPS